MDAVSLVSTLVNSVLESTNANSNGHSDLKFDLNNASSSTHPCVQCQKTFPTAKMLQQHNQTFHTDKHFVCETCGKAFRFRSNLAEHRSVHTALKPFVCIYCNKASRLKGNLTKHILKHHKKEQNEYIGTDDIIIKKGKKSVKDPAAIDFLEKSMIVIPVQGVPGTKTNGNRDSGAGTPINGSKASSVDEQERCFLMSLGLDSGSLDLKAGSPDSECSDTPSRTMNDQLLDKCNSMAQDVEMKEEEDDRSPTSSVAGSYGNGSIRIRNSMSPSPGATVHISTNGFATSTPVNTGKPPVKRTPIFNLNEAITRICNSINNNVATHEEKHDVKQDMHTVVGSPLQGPKTQCPECGKHLRKPRDLIAHLATIHNVPPPDTRNLAVMSSDDQADKDSECGLSADTTGTSDSHSVHNELRQIRQLIMDMKQGGGHSKVEQMLSNLDGRVGRLEKQLEMALNSIYTLVQLQTGINSQVTRFRDDACDQLKNVLALLSESSG